MQQIFAKLKNEVLLFVIITYGLAFLMGIPMALFSFSGKDVSCFVLAQMFYPATGVILGKLLYKRDDILLPKRFFSGFLTVTGIMILWCFISFFLTSETGKIGSSCLAIGFSVILEILYFSEKREKRSAYRLAGKNWGICVRILILFVILFYGPGFLTAIFTDHLSGVKHILSEIINQNQLFFFLSLPLVFILSVAPFLGEEYGWRAYFQPLLQKKFGLIKGVLLLGVLWEFWHLPVVIFYYAPRTDISLIQLIMLRYSTCILISIFMAYAYIKTHNIWLPVFIHFLNNNLPGIYIETDNWTIIIILTLVKIVMYLPFLFSKIFRKQKTE